MTPGGGTLEIDWKVPTDTGETAITSYDLRYIRDDATDRSDGNWSVETGVGTPSNRSYTITGLRGGVKYEIQLRAHNDAGQGPWSQSEAEEPTTVAPSAPSIASITRGDRTLAVVWTAPTNTGGGVITAYDVRYIETSEDETVESNWTVRDNAWRSGDLRYVISNLTNATEYDVQVRAVNSTGDGAWSDTETGTPLPDDIAITLQWEETSIEVAEDAGSVVLKAVFTTTLDAPPVADFTFDVTLTTTDSGTTQNDDYTAPPSSATFVSTDFNQTDVNGQQRYRATRDFTVVIIDDMDDESNETFNVTLAYLTPGLTHLQGGPSTAVVTIQDNEHVPVTLSWEQTDVTVGENAGSATLRAYAITTEDKQPEDGFSFDASISTSDGSAAQPGDYTQVDDTVTFSRNDFSRVTVNGERRYRAAKQVLAPIVDDTSDEPDEDFTATVAYAGPSQPHLQGGPATAAVTIEDNDLPQVTIEAVTTSAQEPGTLTFDLEREGVTNDPLTVNVRVSETGRMLASSQPTTATFDAGSSMTTLEVALTDDTEDEDNSVVTVTVRSGSGYSVVAPASAMATALDDDHVPVTLSWDLTSVTVAERVGEVTLRAVATTAKDKQPESNFPSFVARSSFADGTADSADYSAGLATMSFRQSDFTRTTTGGPPRYIAVKEFTVSILSDSTDEPDETFTATLAYSGSDQPHLRLGNDTIMVTITDDDEPLVSIEGDTSTTGEDTPHITFTLTHDSQAAPSLGVNVRVTESASMLARGAPTQVNFTAGLSTAGLQVNLVNDTEDEEDSEITVEVVNGSGYLPGSRSFATTTVTDDDHVPVTLEWEETTVSVDEDDRMVTLTAVATTKDKRPESGSNFNATVTVSDGSATDPDDYSPSSSTTLAFGPGTFAQETVDGQSRYQATQTVTVSIVPDNAYEPDENFTARLAYETPGESHLRGGNSTATVTITDDDPVPLVLGWEQSEWSVEESDGTVTLRAVATTTINRIPEEGFSFDATVNTQNGDARQPGDYSQLSVTETFVRSDFSSVAFDGQRRYRAEKEFTITIEADSNDEPNEDFSVELSFAGLTPTHPNLTTGITDATVWIIEDDDSTADVQLTRNSSPGRVSEGATLTYTYTVKNNGPGEASVTLISTLDPNLEFKETDPPCSHDSSTTGGDVTCSLGQLMDDESVSVSVEATVESVPNDGIVNRAYVTSSVADPTPGNNTYPATATTTGGGGGGGGFAPAPALVFSEGSSATRTIEENTPSGQNIGEPVEATGDGLTYTLTGDDAAAFDIVADTGQLQTKSALDYETKNAYAVTVTATNTSGRSTDIDVTIDVTDVEEAPELTGPDSIDYSENGVEQLATYVAEDPEGAAVAWSLSGDDAGAFSITDGVLAFNEPPDYEAPADADGDNVYSLTVTASDGTNRATLEVAVAVLNVAGTEDTTPPGPPNPAELSATPGDNPGEVALVVHQFWIDGYRDFNLMRASAVVKRQSTRIASWLR